mmetsp:Transcript_545/g.914  ORF Transcript_545/g.914 Transcript_545/m.914 type:complete len:376 (-) Transcript_545:138-1265(-)|eukprot:CAMPEP_0113624158 /NCGR_PEP_ID=MMETSP0017_2-20120614/12449_1 /TAXON_ID=2856 /ORGANISM="Cylindrotheca closterium" /LENGTH=375 /DNA_ID=CAMNT_0000534171 /DNA_START=8 /DNA_END=1135 /DNA_ORIENTATION=- /assembly_acc=CAM_ASM_000147
MSLWKATLLICLVPTSPQQTSPQLNDNSTTGNIFDPNLTISFNDTESGAPSVPPLVKESQAPSALSTTVPTTKSEFCLNTEGWTFGASVKYTCDDDFVWCSDPGAMENCCKCKPSCCGQCKTRNHVQDPYRPCQYEPTMRPTSVYMPSQILYKGGHPEKKIGQLQLGLIIGSSAFVLFLIVVTIMIRINVRQRQEILSLRRTMAERRNDPSSNNAVEVSSERESRIRLSFFFDTVLSDKNNANVASLRSLRDVMENDDQITTACQSIEEDGAPESPQVMKLQRSNTSGSISRSDLRKSLSSPKRSQRSLRNVFSSWRKQASTGECSICLECYNPGETICVAKADACNHVFHKECLVEWLKNHDCCPLCRVNLLLE